MAFKRAGLFRHCFCKKKKKFALYALSCVSGICGSSVYYNLNPVPSHAFCLSVVCAPAPAKPSDINTGPSGRVHTSRNMQFSAPKSLFRHHRIHTAHVNSFSALHILCCSYLSPGKHIPACGGCVVWGHQIHTKFVSLLTGYYIHQ